MNSFIFLASVTVAFMIFIFFDNIYDLIISSNIYVTVNVFS